MLRDLGLDRSGVICVERVDAALTGQPPLAADRGALRRETAPVWEMVEAVIRGGQAYGTACSLCYGASWPPIAVTLLFGLAVRGSGKAPAPFLAGVRPVADFINTPDVYSLVLAVLAAIVGVMSLTQARANALIGVFISVTTIPAAASIGVSIAFSSCAEARESALTLAYPVSGRVRDPSPSGESAWSSHGWRFGG